MSGNFSNRYNHFIAKMVVVHPSLIDRYVWLRMTARAAELVNAKFDVKAPRNFRMAADKYEWKRWDFFSAAKYFLKFKPETVAAIWSQWFRSPGFDPKFKPSVLLNLWLTVPLFVLAGDVPGEAAEAKEKRQKEAQAIIDTVVNLIGESNQDLTADLLRNMSVAGAVSFLEKTNAPPVLIVMRKVLPFEVTIKLLNALRNKNADRLFGFWLPRFPVEDAAKIKMKLLEIDRISIEEFRLKNEKLKYEHGELTHKIDGLQMKSEPARHEALLYEYKNKELVMQELLKKREAAQKAEKPQHEEEERQRQKGMDESISRLADSLASLLDEYRREKPDSATSTGGKQPAGGEGGGG